MVGIEAGRGRCVRGAIMAAENDFVRGGNFITAYQRMSRSLQDLRMTKVLDRCQPNFQRALAFSVLGTTLMVGYVGVQSYVNAHGGHMPSLIEVLENSPLVGATITETKFKPPPPEGWGEGWREKRGNEAKETERWGKRLDDTFGRRD